MALTNHDKTAKTCDVAGCSKESERSISLKQVADSSLKLKDPNVRSAHLCKDHYKVFKKETKSSRELNQFY
jgi:Tfp pilus assembly major pilin PilA